MTRVSHGWASIGLASLGAAVLACVAPIGLEGAPCPCGSGYKCCSTTQRCAPTAEQCPTDRPPDGGARDVSSPDTTRDVPFPDSAAASIDGGVERDGDAAVSDLGRAGSSDMRVGADQSAGDAESQAWRLHGLHFGPYIDPGESPSGGDNSLSEQELSDRLRAVARYTEWVHLPGCDDQLRPAARLARELGLKVSLTAWIDTDAQHNSRQMDCLVAEAKARRVDLAVVGSETQERGDLPPPVLISYLSSVRERLREDSVMIPVATSDSLGSYLKQPALVDAVDLLLVAISPFRSGASVDDGLRQLRLDHLQLMASTDKEIIVADSGWPSCGPPVRDAIPSIENAAYYLGEFVAWAHATGARYFYSSAFDEPWRAERDGPWGPCWGVFATPGSPKSGMASVFDGPLDPSPHWWDFPPVGPTVYRFELHSDPIETNLAEFLVASYVGPAQSLRIDGTPIDADQIDRFGLFSQRRPLAKGFNQITVDVLSADGHVISSFSRDVTRLDSVESPPRLLYVDVQAGGEQSPNVLGTVVIAVDENVQWGFFPFRWVRGISADGAEVYFSDRTVWSIRDHQRLRTLPFRMSIPSNGFVITPDGKSLYSRDEQLLIAENRVLEQRLALDITTGTGWREAWVPGGPALAPDGKTLYCRHGQRLDLETNRELPEFPYAPQPYLSDMALTPDGKVLIQALFGGDGGGRLELFNVESGSKFSTVADLGGHVGEIGVVDSRIAVVGSTGDPLRQSGKLSVVDLDQGQIVHQISGLSLADNLVVDPATREVFVSTGTISAQAGLRAGVDVYELDGENKLVHTKSFFLGLNRYQAAAHSPANNQIKKLVLRVTP